jgi:hypothetical protein
MGPAERPSYVPFGQDASCCQRQSCPCAFEHRQWETTTTKLAGNPANSGGHAEQLTQSSAGNPVAAHHCPVLAKSGCTKCLFCGRSNPSFCCWSLSPTAFVRLTRTSSQGPFSGSGFGNEAEPDDRVGLFDLESSERESIRRGRGHSQPAIAL